MYPEENMGDIEKIYYRGYEDEEREKFVNKIQQIYDEHEKN